MALTITSVSPSPVPPGGTVTITGTGFTAGSRVCIPAAVATTYVSPTQLTAPAPAEIEGPAGGALQVGVFVLGEDGAVSNVKALTIEMPADKLQTYTTVVAVCGELPGFQRGGQINDARIRGWMQSTAESIRAEMLRRGLPLDPAGWTQPGTDGAPSAAGLLEMINRMGAAARLAYAVASLFGSAETGFARSLQKQHDDEMGKLSRGAYDHMFKPGAATVESGPALSAGDMTDDQGNPTQAFTKGKVF